MKRNGVDRVHEEVGLRLLDDGDAEDPGVVYENVGRPSKILFDLLRGLLHTLRVGHVARNGDRSLHTFGGLLEPGFVARNHHDARALGGKRRCDSRANPARSARYDSSATAKPSRQLDPLCARRRNSSRVLGSSRNTPVSADVIVFEFCFCTPRIIMQR